MGSLQKKASTYIVPSSVDPDPDALRARARDSPTPSSALDCPAAEPLLEMLAPLPPAVAAAKAPDLTYATASSCSALDLLLRMGRGFPVFPTAMEEDEKEEEEVANDDDDDDDDDDDEEEVEEDECDNEEEDAKAAAANALVSGTLAREPEPEPDAAPELVLGRVANSTLLRFLAGILSY